MKRAFGLLLIAVALILISIVPAILLALWDGIRFRNFRSKSYTTLMGGALSLDIFGNVAYSSLLDALFITRDGYHHGRMHETVSSVLGKNWTMGTYTFLAECLIGSLNLLDRNHCWKAIHDPWSYPKPPDVALWKSLLLFALLAVPLGLGIWYYWAEIVSLWPLWLWWGLLELFLFIRKKRLKPRTKNL